LIPISLLLGRLIGHREPIPPVLDPKADLSRGASFAIAGAVVLGSQSTTASVSTVPAIVDKKKAS